MHWVVEHIDQHLDEPLELETLAGVAPFSPFHFHRLFSGEMTMDQRSGAFQCDICIPVTKL